MPLNSQGVGPDDNGAAEAAAGKAAWYDDANNIPRLVQEAERFLITVDKSTRIVSLGQSPAWIIKTAKMLDKQREYVFIPFSGNIVHECKFKYTKEDSVNTVHENIVHVREHRYEEYKNYDESKYREFVLQPKQLDPESIIKRYQEGRGKTVIVDFVVHGFGLCSLLLILIDWADELGIKKELFDSMELIAFYEDPLDFGLDSYRRTLFEQKCFYIWDVWDRSSIGAEIQFPFTVHKISKELIRQLGDSIDVGNKSDRLVPQYKPEQWHTPPPHLDFDENAVNQIKALIIQSLVPVRLSDDAKLVLSNHREKLEKRHFSYSFFPHVGYSKDKKIAAINQVLDSNGKVTPDNYQVLLNGRTGGMLPPPEISTVWP